MSVNMVILVGRLGGDPEIRGRKTWNKFVNDCGVAGE